jgi:hypothetical protein
MDDQLREEYEERAAIKEFCGNLPREQAEREARKEVYGIGYDRTRIGYDVIPR